MTRGIYPIEPGAAYPLGAVPDPHGVNFAIVAVHATGVQLLLFAQHDDPEPFQTIPLDPAWHRTFHCWHVYVRGLQPGTSYAYRFDGPPEGHGDGDRFNKNKVLLDPYARAITTTHASDITFLIPFLWLLKSYPHLTNRPQSRPAVQHPVR